MNKFLVAGAAPVIAVSFALAACSAQSPGNRSGSTAPPAPPTPVAPASPVSAAATITGKCAAGMLDVTLSQFTSMASLQQGATAGAGSDEIAEAYQLTLTNTSTSATAAVTGFGVVFYNYDGEETGSNAQALTTPTFITPGQSLTWTEDPWGTYTAGQGNRSIGPFAAGSMGAVDSGATCQMVTWDHQ